MPAVAVAGAAIAIGVAAEVGTTMAIVAAVGATIGAVGAVTGVKELTIAGGVIGAVGAIGGLASSAGLFGEAGILGSQSGAALGETAAATTAAETMVPGTATVAEGLAPAVAASDAAPALAGMADAASAMSPAADTTGDIINTVTGQVHGLEGVESGLGTGLINSPDVLPTAAADTVASPVTGIQTPSADPMAIPQGSGIYNAPGDAVRYAQQPGNPANPTAAATPTPPPGAAAPAAPQVTGNTASADSLINSSAPTGANGITTARVGSIPVQSALDPLQNANNSGGSIFGDIWRFVRSNGSLSAGILMAGGSFINGALNGLTPAQIDLARAQAQQNIAAANLYNQRAAMEQQMLANMNGPMPVASRAARPSPVTGQVTGQPAPPPPGLINQPRVTGQVTA